MVPMAAHPRRTDPQAASREELELEAATLVVASDYRAALESYLRLAARFRDEPVFSDLATILRAKLSCRARRGVEGSGCD